MLPNGDDSNDWVLPNGDGSNGKVDEDRHNYLKLDVDGQKGVDCQHDRSPILSAPVENKQKKRSPGSKLLQYSLLLLLLQV